MANPPLFKREAQSQRRGATIIPVIAFYAIAIAMVGVWVRSALEHQRLVRRWHEKTQVTWLAEAGLRRAVTRIKAAPDFEGENWQITAAELDSQFAAEVEIQIVPVPLSEQEDDQSNDLGKQARVIAVARYPAGVSKRVQVTKICLIRLEQPSNSLGESR